MGTSCSLSCDKICSVACFTDLALRPLFAAMHAVPIGKVLRKAVGFRCTESLLAD